MKTGEANPLLRQVLSELVDVSRSSGSLKISEAEATKLKNEILDAFQKGDVDSALEKLLAKAPKRRQKIAVSQLIDSALLSFGIDTTDARASWQTGFAELAATATPTGEAGDLRSSPIRDAFRGLTMRLDDRTLSHLKKSSHQQARLEAGLNVALQSDDKVDALRSYEEAIDLKKTPDNILIGLLAGYREEESWKDVIRFFEAAPDAFRNYPAPRQEYALALAMNGESSKARDVLRGLVRDGDNSISTFGLLGKLLKEKYDKLIESGGPEPDKALFSSIGAYMRAFDRDLSELYPGVAVPVLLETQNTMLSRKQAQDVATLVLLNASRRASFGEGHFWDAAAALEMCCCLRDWKAASGWLERAMGSDSEPWMRRSTLLNLKRLLGLREGRNEDVSELKAIIAKLETIPADQRRKMKLPREPSVVKAGAELSSERALGAVLEGTYRFGGRSPKWLSGNYNYEGIAHDVRVTPSDVVYFTRVLKAAHIHEIADPFAASGAIDQLIRGHFGTPSMEDSKSVEHERYDRVMPGLKKLMAATRENSQTNVSADWINCLADCRQHAPAKLMLWEVWKRGRVNDLLFQIRDAVKHGKPIDEVQEKLTAINSWEMRILDGQIVEASTGKMLEEHTMTILVKRKEPGENGVMRELESAHLADSFYQNVHHLGSGEIDVRVKDGKLWIEVPEASANGKKIALQPAAYSFDRAAPSLDFGQLKFRGVQVASPGWERDIPVAGVDLDYLHAFVDAQQTAPATAVAAP